MERCSGCGQNLPDTATVCLFCGFDHRTGLRSERAEREHQKRGLTEEQKDRARATVEANEQKRQSEKREARNMAFGCIGISAVLVAVGIVVLIKTEDKWGPSLAAHKGPVDDTPTAKERPKVSEELAEARFFERLWNSPKPTANRRLFAAPFYFVFVEDGKRFVAPTDTWHSATSDLASANTVVICEMKTTSSKFGRFGIEMDTLDDATVELKVCFIDKQDLRRRRWLEAFSSIPESVTSGGGATVGGISKINGTRLPERLGSLELFAAAVKSVTGSTSDPQFEPPEEKLDRLRGRYVLSVRGSQFESTSNTDQTWMGVSPDGRRLGLVYDTQGDDRRHFMIWNLEEGEFGEPKYYERHVATVLGWANDSELKVRFVNRTSIDVRTLPSNQVLVAKSLPSHKDANTFWYMDNGATQMAAKVDNELHLLSVEQSTEEPVRLPMPLNNYGGEIMGFSNSGKYFASFSHYLNNRGTQRQLTWWSVLEGRQIGAVGDEQLDGGNLLFTPDDSQVGMRVVLRRDGNKSTYGLRFYQLADGRTTSTLPLTGKIVFAPDGDTMAVIRKNGVQLWSLRKEMQIKELTTDLTSISGLAFSPDGTGLYVAYHSKKQLEILHWRHATGEIID